MDVKKRFEKDGKEKRIKGKITKVKVCTASNKVSIKEVKRRLKEAHGNQVTIVESTFLKMHAKATFIDVDFGPWDAVVKDVLSGHL